MAGEATDGKRPRLLRRLLDEHQVLLPALDAWVRSLSSTSLDARAAHVRLADLAAKLRAHAQLEERTLFAAMVDILGSAALAGYEMQHDDIDELLERLLEEPASLPPDAASLADRLLWICESHFEIEEKHIFREAEQRLTPDQWEALRQKAEQVAPR